MKEFLPVLQRCDVFHRIDGTQIEEMMGQIRPRITAYGKDEIIALEGDQCVALGIVLEGNIEIRKTYASGKVVTLARMGKGDIFGEAVIFSKTRQYPATIFPLVPVQICYIPRDDIFHLSRRFPIFLENFMELLSDKVLMLNKKVRDLSFETIRQKIANVILEEYDKQRSLTLTLPLSRKNMAEHMGIQRPSLSRELIKMRVEGLIDFDGRSIIIKDLAGLEEYLV